MGAKQMDRETAIRNFTLMLMYLTSWQERADEMRRFWKGYDFDVLDRLAEDDLIATSHSAKSAYLTEEGERTAVALLRDHGVPISQVS
jgi:hypothetical protein